MSKILGLDVSKSSVSCCLLSEYPDDIKEFYYTYPFISLSANVEGIKKLLAFNADIAILEPTGTNYSRIWQAHLIAAGVEVRFVDHKKLRYYRARHLELPNKDDDADALALAAYGMEHQNNSSKFLTVQTQASRELRYLVLRLQHLKRIRNPIINRIRQDLAWQFPEVANTRSFSTSSKPPLLWGWLAGLRKSSKYERLYQQSIGLGINDSVRNHSRRLCHLHDEEYTIERKLEGMIAHERYTLYRKVLSSFGFGLRTESLILSQIYPLSKYLQDNQPIIVVRKGRISGKPTVRYLSERRFLKNMGLAPTLEYSGDSKKVRIVGGSALCRMSLWCWIFAAVEPKNNRNNAIKKKLGEYLDGLKASGKPVQLARTKTAAFTVKLLFRELIKVICD